MKSAALTVACVIFMACGGAAPGYFDEDMGDSQKQGMDELDWITQDGSPEPVGTDAIEADSCGCYHKILITHSRVTLPYNQPENVLKIESEGENIRVGNIYVDTIAFHNSPDYGKVHIFFWSAGPKFKNEWVSSSFAMGDGTCALFTTGVYAMKCPSVADRTLAVTGLEGASYELSLGRITVRIENDVPSALWVGGEYVSDSIGDVAAGDVAISPKWNLDVGRVELRVPCL
jgi:hypothetical protein